MLVSLVLILAEVVVEWPACSLPSPAGTHLAVLSLPSCGASNNYINTQRGTKSQLHTRNDQRCGDMAEFIQTLPSVWGWLVGDAPAARDALARFSWKSPIVVVKVIDSVLRGIAQVAFGNNPLSGLLILIGLFVGHVNSGLGALLCSLTAIFTAKVLYWQDDAVAAGHSNFNAVLIGTVTPAVYPIVFREAMPPAVWGYMMIAAVFTVCVMGGLGRIMEGHNIPALTLPFNIAVSTTFLCVKMAGYGTGTAAPTPDPGAQEDIDWGQVFRGTLLAAGHVWAVEDVACSCLVLLALFIFSPILALVSYVGATLGTLTGLVVSTAPYAAIYQGLWGYNGFLAAGSISFFMVPKLHILLMAAINAVFATFLHSALSPVFAAVSVPLVDHDAANGLPVFTFPFCLASVLMLAAAMASGPPSLRVSSPAFPELHLVQHDRISSDSPVTTKNEDDAVTQPML
ncbi:Urea transporter 2 [Chionoecetes opilio]|uniref:Urea transporter 2 n=1 Tax=Chionoecetes opilio TaxID=41210 RepID=A0A8J8WC01_CHIOP|nr:Urea transporter 2 [Chionoecetes opilio]